MSSWQQRPSAAMRASASCSFHAAIHSGRVRSRPAARSARFALRSSLPSWKRQPPSCCAAASPSEGRCGAARCGTPARRGAPAAPRSDDPAGKTIRNPGPDSMPHVRARRRAPGSTSTILRPERSGTPGNFGPNRLPARASKVTCPLHPTRRTRGGCEDSPHRVHTGRNRAESSNRRGRPESSWFVIPVRLLYGSLFAGPRYGARSVEPELPGVIRLLPLARLAYPVSARIAGHSPRRRQTDDKRSWRGSDEDILAKSRRGCAGLVW